MRENITNLCTCFIHLYTGTNLEFETFCLALNRLCNLISFAEIDVPEATTINTTFCINKVQKASTPRDYSSLQYLRINLGTIQNYFADTVCIISFITEQHDYYPGSVVLLRVSSLI